LRGCCFGDDPIVYESFSKEFSSWCPEEVEIDNITKIL
jgi:hypothetical protein